MAPLVFNLLAFQDHQFTSAVERIQICLDALKGTNTPVTVTTFVGKFCPENVAAERV